MGVDMSDSDENMKALQARKDRMKRRRMLAKKKVQSAKEAEARNAKN